MNSRMLAVMAILVGAGLLWAPEVVVAQKKQAVEGPKTVIGPRNPWLAAGARAIEDGNPKRGVELTELGLANAQGSFERKAALSNLCAGYLLIDKPEKALDYCNQVIEMDTDFWRAYNNRALVYLALGRYGEAHGSFCRMNDIARSLHPVAGRHDVVWGAAHLATAVGEMSSPSTSAPAAARCMR